MSKEKLSYKIRKKPEMQNSSLVIGWNEDAGRLGTKVIDYLIEKLDCTEFGELESSYFFPLTGVTVEEDVAQFPESKFYYCQEKELVLLKSNVPRLEWYKFLSSVLDVAIGHCSTKEIYTIGGMISPSSHNIPRQMLAISNLPEFQDILREYDLITDVHYETQYGQRPTLNSFFLWVAKQRSIYGVSIWIPIPFYLVPIGDPSAWRSTLHFLNNRLNLEMDIKDLDMVVSDQYVKIDQLRNMSPEINNHLNRIEANYMLSQEENAQLVKELGEFLNKYN